MIQFKVVPMCNNFDLKHRSDIQLNAQMILLVRADYAKRWNAAWGRSKFYSGMPVMDCNNLKDGDSKIVT